MCSAGSQQGLLRKVPVTPVSIPGPIQTAVSSGPKTNVTMLRKTAPESAVPPAADNEVRPTLHAITSATRTEIPLFIVTCLLALVRDASSPDFAGGTAAAEKTPRVFDR